ncbi:MAG: 16S rRNA (adenine(1518)-N(6)/adenine(1519)-N(6))-dimethyltransferase RsmA [bacterium]
MDLLNETKAICKLNNIKPSRSRGQNFLIEEDIYNQIIESADLREDDIVLEVGPGLGFLTAKLAVKAKKVIAVELDDKLVEVLKYRLEKQNIKNVEAINENILNFKSERNFKIVANLPYNITSVFLRKFLSESEIKPKLMVLMLQKEVAERICAKAGQMSLLSVSVQSCAKPEILLTVSRKNFWPEPEVDSAIVKISPDSRNFFSDKINEKDFFRLVKSGFSAKRKMLKNNLASGFGISQAESENRITSAGFNPKIRAQELSVEDWEKLFVFFAK